jgi:hypothetical protein
MTGMSLETQNQRDWRKDCFFKRERERERKRERETERERERERDCSCSSGERSWYFIAGELEFWKSNFIRVYMLENS